MKAGWQTKTFSDVLDIRNGKNQREVESADGEYPIFGSAGNVMGYATSYICKAGATIVGRKGNINTPIYTETNFWNVDTAFGLEAKSELDSRFLYYFCLSYDFSIHNKGTTIPSLVKSDLLQIKIQFPPLPEQQRIVAILDEAFDGIATAKANAEQNLQNARALFESHLQSVFTQRGEGWVDTPLGDVCGFVRGPFGGSLKKSIFVDDGYAVYEQQHAIYDQFSDVRYFIDEDKFNEMKRFELLPNDLIMSCSGTMGRIAVVPEGIKRGIINQALLKLTPSSKISKNFLKIWMESEAFQDALKTYSGGAAIQNVASVKILKEIRTPLPSLKEQERVVTDLDAIREETQRLESLYQRKLAALDELKKSLLHQAFSGAL